MLVYEWHNPGSQLLGIADEHVVRALCQMILEGGILFAQNLEGRYEAVVDEVGVACLDDHVRYVAYAPIQLPHQPGAGWEERVVDEARVAEYVELFGLIGRLPHAAIDQWMSLLLADRGSWTPARVLQLIRGIQLGRWRGREHALHAVGQVVDVEAAALVGYGQQIDGNQHIHVIPAIERGIQIAGDGPKRVAHQRDALPLEMQHHAANDAGPLNDGVLHASRIRRGATVARQLDAQDAQMAGQQWDKTCKAAHIIHPAVNGEQRTHLTAAVPAAGDVAPRRAYVKVNKLP